MCYTCTDRYVIAYPEESMKKQRTVRFDDNLDSLVDQFTKKNDLKFNQFITLAAKKFISERNTIELEPVTIEASDSAWDEAMKSSFSEHKKAMDEMA